MDGVAVMRALLLAHAPLTDLVADRIIAGTVPIGTAYPAVGITEISRVELDTAARNGRSALVTARIQVTVHASSYPQQKAAIRAAKLGSGIFKGEIAGVSVRSVLRGAVGPDLGDEEAGVREQSRDFMVAYIDPN